MAAILFVCFLCLILPVGGEVVEHVSATRGNVVCSAGEFLFTENTGLALQDIISPSRIIKQFREMNSSEECRNLCCDYVDCNVASFISLENMKVCALVTCVDNLSCLWQSYSQGVASFLDRKIKQTSAEAKTVAPTTQMTQPTVTTSATQEVATSTFGNTPEDDAWWFNPFNWGNPKDYPDEVNDYENPNKKLIDSILNADNNNEIAATLTTLSAPSKAWDEMIGSPDVSNNVNAPDVNNAQPPGIFGRIDQAVDGIKSNEMGTSWNGDEPHEMPMEDNTTYTVGLAVFLASLGLAGVLVLTIHFISKSRKKSRYHLLEVEEDLQGDKQPFLPK